MILIISGCSLILLSAIASYLNFKTFIKFEDEVYKRLSDLKINELDSRVKIVKLEGIDHKEPILGDAINKDTQLGVALNMIGALKDYLNVDIRAVMVDDPNYSKPESPKVIKLEAFKVKRK